jgi:mannosylglycerate hydrolase
VRLTAGSDHLSVMTRFDNHARDHRLRAWFPTKVGADRLVSDGQFLMAQRPLQPPRGEGWVQPHPGTYPQQEFSMIKDAGGRGFAVIADGLPEVAPGCLHDGTTGLHLTLLRCVGWLSRDDFSTRRRTNAGPTIATPQAQCPGRHTFRYALVPLRGRSAADPFSDRGDHLRWKARAFLNPPLTRQGVLAGAVAGRSLVSIDNPEVAVSCIRKHPRRDTLLMRMWNQTGCPQRQTFLTGRPLASVWSADILEERTGPLDHVRLGPRSIVFEVPPCRIMTIEMEFEPLE